MNRVYRGWIFNRIENKTHGERHYMATRDNNGQKETMFGTEKQLKDAIDQIAFKELEKEAD